MVKDSEIDLEQSQTRKTRENETGKTRTTPAKLSFVSASLSFLGSFLHNDAHPSLALVKRFFDQVFQTFPFACCRKVEVPALEILRA